MKSLLICIALKLLCLVYDVWGQSQPQITRNILPEIKRVGEAGALQCTVTRQFDNVVEWIHDERRLTADQDVVVEDRYNIVIEGQRKIDVYFSTTGDSNTYTLVIRRLQLEDAGTYTCQVVIRGQQKFPSKDGEMVVLVPPSIILQDSDTTAKVQEGGRVDISCAAQGEPTPQIQWVRPNGKSLPAPYNTFSHVGRSLGLRNITREGRGVYRCIADNNVIPTASHDITLYVSFRPFAIPVQTTYGQAQNMQYDVTLECRVSGFPAPDLQWYQRNSGNSLKAINDDERHMVHVLIAYGQTLSMDEYWFQLTIINVQGNDYGDYVCEGTNNLGVHRAVVKLYQTSECQGSYCYLAMASEVKSAATNVCYSCTTPLLLLMHAACIVIYTLTY